MTSADSTKVDQRFLANAMASFLQIGALLLLLVMCFNIVRPFISIVVWALILAVAIYPLHVSLTAKLAGREKTSAAIFVLIGLAVILVPTFVLGESTFRLDDYHRAVLRAQVICAGNAFADQDVGLRR